MYDLNLDGLVDIADAFYIAGRKSGIFSTWGGTFNSKLFTPAQYNAIKATTSNLKATYPGVTNVTLSTVTSGGVADYYLIAPGYAGQVTY